LCVRGVSGWGGRPVGGWGCSRASLRARGSPVGVVSLFPVAAMAVLLFLRGRVWLGRSATRRLPRWLRPFPGEGGWGWGGRPGGSCPGDCAFARPRAGAVGAVGLLAAAAVAACLSVRGAGQFGRSACWRLPQWPRVCACAAGCSWGSRPAGGRRGGRAFVPAREGAVGAICLFAAASVATCLSVRAGVRLGRSACWRLPLLPRVCACAAGCRWGGRRDGGCRGCRVFVSMHGGAVRAVGLLAVAAVAVRLCVRGRVQLGRSACWRLPRLPRVCPCAGGWGWGGRPVGGCRNGRASVRARGSAV